MKNDLSPRNLKRQKKKDGGYKGRLNIEKKDIVYYNYLLTITYDGTTYGGYARQKFANTIEQTLEDTLIKHLGEHVKTVNASRTDAKVHAMDQKVMFKSPKKLNPEKFTQAINEVLPKSIKVLSTQVKEPEFHSRFDVTSKSYIYKIHTKDNIFLNNYSYFLDLSDIDVKRINEICRLFIGEKDFVGFCSPKKDAKDTTRKINSFEFNKKQEGLYEFEINANGFLYNMVRIIIGSVIYFYENNITDEEIKDIIESKEKTKAQKKVSPVGLYLSKIYYS